MIIFYGIKHIDHFELSASDSTHAVRVLRKSDGDQVHVTDGNGSLYKGELSVLSKKNVQVVSLTELSKSEQRHKRSIAIAPTKNNDRFEWFLEKATEIGITDIYPFVGKHSERKVIKEERLEKILVSAMKQSKNFYKPTLHPLVPFKSFVSSSDLPSKKYIAHCMEPDRHLNELYTSGSDAVVLIGPEGDFADEEVKLAKSEGWSDVSLGNSRLRTETAGIIACHLLNL